MIATRVSCGVAEITNSFDIKTPRRAWPRSGLAHGCALGPAMQEGRGSYNYFCSSDGHLPRSKIFVSFRRPSTGRKARQLPDNHAAGLVDETSKTNVHHQPKSKKHEQSGRPAITHQRQRNSGDR